LISILRDAKKAGIDFEELASELDKPEGTNKTYWKDGKNGPKYSVEREDFFDFFESRYPQTRKDYFRHSVFTKNITGEWEPIDNHHHYLESDCAEVGLSPNYLRRHLSAWCVQKQPELLIDVVKWDGQDHILDALLRIKTKNIEHIYFVDLMKEWFANIIRRMENAKHQNRFVIFRGKQGIGKDFAINAMLEGFGRYANEIDVQNTKTEIYRTIKNMAVAVIPEFDETGGSSISVLKSIVTAKSIEMRDLYKNDSTSRPIRCSFISASNFDDVLRDPSGNRRFMIFDLESIEHTFEHVDADQILAQAFHLAEKKHVASKAAQDAMKLIIEAETPTGSDQLLIEEIQEYLKEKHDTYVRAKQGVYQGDIESKFLGNVPERIRWFMIAEDVTRMGRKYGLSGRKCQTILKRGGFAHYDSKSTYYLPWTEDKNINH
jgi:hypothetical protein